MQQLFALSLGIAAMVFAASQTHAQNVPVQCAARADVVQVLASRYGETRRSIGLAPGNQLMEIYASDTGTWSLTVSTPDGRTCLVASGSDFETVSDALARSDPPA